MRCTKCERSVSAAPVLTILIPVLAALFGCQDDERPRGLPSAADWKSPEAQQSQVDPGAAGAGEAARAREGGDPHAGMQMGGGDDPHAGMQMGAAGDPHAGMQMGGGDDPHAGLDMGGEEDPAMAAMQPPDPDRKIDDSKFLRGTIRVDAKLTDRIKSGAVMFLSAVPIEPVTGEVLGAPVAVARLDVDKLPMKFELTERDAMAAGTRFEGDVMITAWVDGDGEARTKEPGDVEGRLRARIPARGLDLVLDTALR